MAYLNNPNIVIECFQNEHIDFKFIWGFSYKSYDQYRCTYKGYNIDIFDYYKNRNTDDVFNGWFVVVNNIFVGVADYSSDMDNVLLKCIQTLDNVKEDAFIELKFLKIS